MTPSNDHLKRRVMMTILALSWVSSNIGWALMEARGPTTPVLRAVFGLNMVFHPVVFVVVWRRLLAAHLVDLACLVFAAGICAACMALGLYSPVHGAGIDLQPLYLWIPVIYVFVFALAGHRHSLYLSLAIMALFFVISLPYLVNHITERNGNFTVQLHLVSAVLVTALHFFASYQKRLQAAQLTVEDLAHLANTDELTQVANRRRIVEVLMAEMARFARYGHAFSIVLIDIDHFKTINDRHGHAAGDQALIALTHRMRQSLRKVDVLGRWGGEEFIVVMPETGYEAALHSAAALCRQVADGPVLESLGITVSCGVASVLDRDDPDAMLRRADAALYEAKRLGRNRAEGERGEPCRA